MSGRRVLIIDFSADGPDRPFGRAIAAALPAGVSSEIVRCDADADWTDRLSCVSHVILSGSDIPLPRAEPWFEPMRRRVRAGVESGVPILGICFGHQFIVQSLGEPDMVRRARQGEFGITVVRTLPESANDPVIGATLNGEASVYNLHVDEVVAASAVPTLDLAVLAENDQCAVQAFRVAGRPVWGVQFHPELTGGVVAEMVAVAPLSFGQTTPDADELRKIAEGPTCQRPELLAAFLAVDRA